MHFLTNINDNPRILTLMPLNNINISAKILTFLKI